MLDVSKFMTLWFSVSHYSDLIGLMDRLQTDGRKSLLKKLEPVLVSSRLGTFSRALY